MSFECRIAGWGLGSLIELKKPTKKAEKSMMQDLRI